MPPILIYRHDKQLIYPNSSGDFGERIVLLAISSLIEST